MPCLWSSCFVMHSSQLLHSYYVQIKEYMSLSLQKQNYIYLNQAEPKLNKSTPMEGTPKKEKEEESAPLLLEGKKHIDKKQYDQAMKCFKQLLDKDPSNYLPIYQLGVVQQQKGLKKQAKEYFQKVLSMKPKDLKVLLKIAMFFKQSRNYSRAIDLLQTCKELEAEGAQSYMMMGYIYKQKSQHQKALQYFLKVIEINRQSDEANTAYYQAGYIYLYELEIEQKGLNYLQIAADQNINSFQTYVLLAKKKLQRREFKDVIVFCRKAIAADPTQQIAYRLMGTAQLVLHNGQKAINYFEKCLQLQQSYKNHHYLALAYFINLNFQKSVEHFKKQHQDDFERIAAETLISNLYNIYPSNGVTFSSLKGLIVYNGYSEVPTEEIMKKLPTDEILVYQLANSNLNQQNIKYGIYWHQLAIKINPQFIPSLMQLAENYFKKGQLKQAAHLYTRIVEINPRLLWGYLRLAKILEKMNAHEKAITHLKEASKIIPNNPKIQYKLAYHYCQLQSRKEAIQSYIQAFKNTQKEFNTLSFIKKENAVASEQRKIETTNKEVLKDPNQRMAQMTGIKTQNPATSTQLKAVEAKKEKDRIQYEFYSMLGVSFSMVDKQNQSIECFEKSTEYRQKLDLLYQNILNLQFLKSKLWYTLICQFTR